MSTASVQAALRGGLFQCLAADGTLRSLLGGDRFYDGVPRKQAMPYLVLQDMESRPLLAEAADGFVHDLSLSIYSNEASRDEAIVAAERAVETLIHGPVTVPAHHLVNLTMEALRSSRLRDGRGFQVSCRMRVVTEPAL